MAKLTKRDDFTEKIKVILAKRASYICSNPECRRLTLFPSDNPEKFNYIGNVAHITAASENGPRYDISIESEDRSSVENGIFLCSNCADMIDKNQGKDFPVKLLKKWKEDHEKWIKENINRSHNNDITIINGEIYAKGKENIIGIETSEPVKFNPGTKVTAEGEKNVTGALIGSKKVKK